jgi:pilus assembly protein CpaC
MTMSPAMLFSTVKPIARAVLLSMACFVAAPSFAASSAFYVPINRSELVTTSSDMSEVIITDPDVADVFVHGKRKVSVIGKAIGQTTLRVFDADHKLLRSMDVSVTYDLPAVRRALREYLPNERIGVSMINTRMALTGTISSAEAAGTAIEIAEEFVRGKLIGDQANSRKKFVEGNDVTAGEVSPIINLMKISAGQQVMLRIRIGEIQRSALKNLGVNLTAFNGGTSGFQLGTGAGRFGNVTGDVPVFGAGQFAFSEASDAFGIGRVTGEVAGFDLAAAVDALERDGILKVLAEPNLVALSGEEAQFLAGGEFPIPVPQQLGTTTIEYKPFGVALKFTPYVLSENRLRIQVNPEVSEISNERVIETSDGFTAPSIVTRRASTTVELAPGESFMIAGLIRDNMISQIDELPGVGEIPVLSALFRSTSFQRNETELVIAVTPYLVDPLKGSDVKLPTDDFKPASFMESIFFGAISGTRGNNPSVEGPSGFMVD